MSYSSVWMRADRGEGGRPVVVQAETGNSTAQHYGRHLGLADSASEGERCDEVKWTTADREPECCIRPIPIGIASLAPTAPPGTRRSKEHHQHRAIFLRSAPHRASSAGWPTTTQHTLPAAAISRYHHIHKSSMRSRTAEALNYAYISSSPTSWTSSTAPR